MAPIADCDHVEALVGCLAMGERCGYRAEIEAEILDAAGALGPDRSVAPALLSHGVHEPLALYLDRHGQEVFEGCCPLSGLGASQDGSEDTLRDLERRAPLLDCEAPDRVEAVTRLAECHDDPRLLAAGLAAICSSTVEDVEIFSQAIRLDLRPCLAADLGRRLERSFDDRDTAWRTVVARAVSSLRPELPAARLKLAMPVSRLLDDIKARRWNLTVGDADGTPFSAHERLRLAAPLPETGDLFSFGAATCTRHVETAIAEIRAGAAGSGAAAPTFPAQPAPSRGIAADRLLPEAVAIPRGKNETGARRDDPRYRPRRGPPPDRAWCADGPVGAPPRPVPHRPRRLPGRKLDGEDPLPGRGAPLRGRDLRPLRSRPCRIRHRDAREDGTRASGRPAPAPAPTGDDRVADGPAEAIAGAWPDLSNHARLEIARLEIARIPGEGR